MESVIPTPPVFVNPLTMDLIVQINAHAVAMVYVLMVPLAMERVPVILAGLAPLVNTLALVVQATHAMVMVRVTMEFMALVFAPVMITTGESHVQVNVWVVSRLLV